MKQFRSSKALLVDKAGNVLILRRSETHPTLAFDPDLPGGMIEDSESHEEGLAREILEETGLIIPPETLVRADIYIHPISKLTNLKIERSLYVARLDEVEPAVVISWEHDQFDWKPVSALKRFERPVQKQLDKLLGTDLLSTI